MGSNNYDTQLFVGAKGLVSREDGKILIVREAGDYEEGTQLGKWDVVGGRIGNNEPLYDGLYREIKEESGLRVSIGQLLGVTENFIEIKGSKCHIIRIYYNCVCLELPEVMLSSDHDQYEWIDPDEHESYDLMDDVAKMFKNFIKIKLP